MDSIDRINPVGPLSGQLGLRVADSNKDGKHKGGDDQPPQEKPHDILELHSDLGVEEVIQIEDSPEPPAFGLDIAV